MDGNEPEPPKPRVICLTPKPIYLSAGEAAGGKVDLSGWREALLRVDVPEGAGRIAVDLVDETGAALGGAVGTFPTSTARSVALPPGARVRLRATSDQPCDAVVAVDLLLKP